MRGATLSSKLMDQSTAKIDLRTSRARRLVDGALDWFIENLELFDPFREAGKFDQYYAKPLLELSLTCMLYVRSRHQGKDHRINEIALFVDRIWRRPEYWQRLVRFPETLLLYGMTSIALRRCGLGNSCDAELMARVLEEGYASAVEVVPYRALDFRYMIDCGEYNLTFPTYSEIYNGTLLSKNPTPLYLTDEDVYAVTHTLFYISDFGARAPEAIPQEQLPAAKRLVALLLGVYVRSKNWDLVAELLISCQCLDWRPGFVFDTAWEDLMTAQRADGVVPGPYFSAEKMQKLSGIEQRVYDLKQNYHTTLVSALAGFLIEEMEKHGASDFS